ncbi:protein kinase [Microbulbifer thermotolerans]|uniref:bifunctional serine/threonine-protein kinase/formylglycine-generating enzyme family protein n=1 Tax=Microbulbifer thermotolerans TaxID=252514 RepID=UPI0008DF8435|nr:bifunctional serine/threonine-protein kinase/formylglycine-generating enzyme family protein [Microbulbifer thermotolerans]MCX2782039.1 protein kinase [Microbulbifer thermotolerans]SFC36106.1 Serine/threonine protein kinase [Microbulbifer thermotolerans]
MNDKTRIVRKGSHSEIKPTEGPLDDGDTTVFVANDNTGANDHPPVGGNPGLIPTAAAGFTADATVFQGGTAAPEEGDATRILASPPPREAVFFESPSSGAVTKTVIKGRFELDKLLGAGGMGAVYKALDRRKLEANDSEPYVAIKLLNDDFRQHPDAFISLQREARKSQTLAHPNIVTVYDFDRDGDRVFMTMEFLEGAPLDKLLREHADVGLEYEKACSVLYDISQALIYAHSHGIVHSDFKPGNIFVTNKKGAKVFDFGIARAVTEGSMASNVGERTLFDAGTLGALTPAYASLEMLKGAEPAPSDDVYALGCVAYELFAGRHPFGKLPADKAWEKKLKPKRIKSLSRKQWRALESALELKREERTPTVEKFVHGFFVNNTWKWLLGAAFASLLVGGAVGYNHLERENAAEQQRVKIELEKKLEQELLQRRIADKREAIDRLISLSILTPDWEDDLRVELQEYAELNPSDEEYLDSSRERVYEIFVAAATGQLNLGNLDQADAMLSSAASWYEESTEAAEIRSRLDREREELRARLEAERLAAEREAERLRQEELRRQRLAVAREKQQKIDAVLDEMELALRCGFNMQVSAVSAQLNRLAQLDAVKAQKIRPVLAEEFSNCFSSLAVRDPLRTEPLLNEARILLPNQSNLQEFKLDFCAHLRPGSGGRGNRYTCADRLADGTDAPRMVVVTGSAGKPLAIGKYEISNREFGKYCAASAQCEPDALGAANLPVNNISIAQAQAYIDWLSAQTGNEYRLPTEREWFAAANANGMGEVADRNCHLKYRGVEKGAELVATRAGSPNGFGLINAVGNVQEWAYTSEGELMAVGGSRRDPMSRCLATTKRQHTGEADELTGFRIVRDLDRP